MSEILDNVSLEKFKNRIKFDIEHCFKYVEKQCINNSEDKVGVTIHMGNECLKQQQQQPQKWHAVAFSKNSDRRFINPNC